MSMIAALAVTITFAFQLARREKGKGIFDSIIPFSHWHSLAPFLSAHKLPHNGEIITRGLVHSENFQDSTLFLPPPPMRTTFSNLSLSLSATHISFSPILQRLTVPFQNPKFLYDSKMHLSSSVIQNSLEATRAGGVAQG